MCMFFLSLFCLYLSLCLCFLLSYAVNKDLYINTENNIFISASMPTIVTRPSQIGRITRRARPSVRPTVCLSVLYDIVYFIYCLGDTQRQLLLDPSPVCLVLCSPCGFHVEWFHVLLYPIKPSSFWSSSTSFSMHVSDVTLFPVVARCSHTEVRPTGWCHLSTISAYLHKTIKTASISIIVSWPDQTSF